MRELVPVTGLVLDQAFGNPRGDQDSGNPNTEAIKVESVLFTIPSSLRISQTVASGNVNGRRNMISKTTMLIPGQNEEGLIPLR